MWYLYTNKKELIDNPIKAPENNKLCDYAYYEYCQLRKAHRELVAIFIQKDDMNKYMATHELEPHRAWEIIGDKVFCEKQLRDCEYYDGGCILQTCVQKELDGIKAFAEFLKTNASNFNISTEKIDEMLKMFTPIALKNAGLREHYQVDVAETLKTVQSYLDENLPTMLEYDRKIKEIRQTEYERRLKLELGEVRYSRYLEKQNKQKRNNKQ